MNMQLYIDHLLETENLTADLEDEEAKWLLDWGISQVTMIVGNMSDEEAAYEMVNTLMDFIRRVSHTVVRRKRRTPKQLSVMLSQLGEIYAQAYGHSRPLSPAVVDVAVTRLISFSALDAVKFLTEFFVP